MRAVPVSRNMRADFRCSSMSGCVRSRCIAPPAICAISRSAVGTTTRARSPCTISTMPGTLQRLQRLADRRASDAVDFHQFALGGKLRARRDFARANAVHQTVEDFLVKLPALNDLSHGVVCANDDGLMTLPRDSRSLKGARRSASTVKRSASRHAPSRRTTPRRFVRPSARSRARRGAAGRTTPGTAASPARGRRPR